MHDETNFLLLFTEYFTCCEVLIITFLGMNIKQQTYENAWLIIRLVGVVLMVWVFVMLCFNIIAWFDLLDKLEKLRNSFSQANTRMEASLYKALIWSFVYNLGFFFLALYFLFGGRFIHRRLCSFPTLPPRQLSNHESNNQDEHRHNESLSNSLYREFLRSYPKADQYSAKERHEAFRVWKNDKGH